MHLGHDERYVARGVSVGYDIQSGQLLIEIAFAFGGTNRQAITPQLKPALFQIIFVSLLFQTVAFSGFTAGWLTYRQFYNAQHQLIL